MENQLILKWIMIFMITCLLLIFVQCERNLRTYSLIDDYCPENCFCPRLEEVWCKNVPMTGISDRMWPTLENLTIMNAEFDRLTSKMFSQYLYLKRLHIESSKVISIAPHTFAGLPRLQLLRLYGNMIDRLDPYSFSHLSHVKEIYLNDNNVKVVARNAFHSSVHLGTLDLRNNPIQTLERGAFNGLRHVERLLLPSDMILIEPGAFDNLSDIHYLEIRQWKPKETRWQGIAPYLFRGLRNVKTLQIEKSDLGTLHNHAFNGLINVEYLYIRNSMITRIRQHTFTNMHHVRRLGLTKNFIDHIDFMTLITDQKETKIHHRRGIRQLDMNKNRLNCTCPNNAWILYEPTVMNNFTSILRNNTCSWPVDLDGLDLYTASNKVKDIVCEYGYDTDNGAGLIRFSLLSIIISVLCAVIFR